ncbi:hypothetical protein D6D28_10444 [Aureobasidium pullulans]|uniref:Uncharacterized protein n=1 Tax=Aureobasidium pullulans TaxID=5580 RepID=A0A4S8RYW5_AURPU|nr:hypothetical protein D6D28_10444 [Aureobasidium pullulans]
MWVLHGAYKKMWRGEDSRQIMIAFLTPTTDAQTTIHHTKELAIKTGSSEKEAENVEHEFIFLWEVPDDNVIHIVSMDLVVRRGFALPEIWTAQALPNLSDLRSAIEDHGYELSPLERGYLCGVIACMFGVRAPVHEIAFQMSRWARRGNHARKSWEIIDQAIEEAIQDRKITVAEDLDIEAEKAYLMFELSWLEDAHDETVMEIGWALQDRDHAGIVQAKLANEELKIVGHRQSTADQIETMCQMVGL